MASWRDEVLLEGDFYLAAKKRTVFKVTLIPGGLFYSAISTVSTQYEEKSIQTSDVIGCQCSETRNISPARPSSSLPAGNAVATFTVFAYPFRKKVFSGKRTRHRQAVTFEISSSTNFEENRKIAQKWRNVINCLARGMHITASDVDTCEPPPWGRFLFLVNPHSGPGRAMQIFKNEVEPMIAEANIPYKLIVTEYAGHARDLVQNLELSEWGAVVIVSGDGLVYEVINGLMQRVDWNSAIKKPVGCIPGGSGNALACAINYAAGEPVDINAVLHSVFILIKHRVVPMDLVLVQTPSQQHYSFLSVTWGIVADIDFESEKYRNLGEARFTLGAIKRIVNLRAYHGRLSFLPVAEYTPKTSAAPKTLKKIRRFSLRSSSSSRNLSSSGSIDSISSRHSQSPVVLTGARSLSTTPPVNGKDRNGSLLCSVSNGSGDANFTISEQSGSDTETNSPAKTFPNHYRSGAGEGGSNGRTVLDAVSDKAPAVLHAVEGTTLNTNESKAYSSSATASTEKTLTNGRVPANSKQTKNVPFISTSKDEAGFEEETVHAAKKDGEAVPTPLLPPLDQPVPDNWVVEEGKFVLACAVYQTHLGSDMLAAPSSRMADGIIHLMFVRDGISRNHLLNLFLTFSEGTHVDSPYVEFVPVLAFRLEPDISSGNIMIDGERLDPVPVQGQVLPGVARVMAIQ
ncbi:hypothetical protein BaRGS_00002583 [Batillaria attramentaria]|uniref:sphingosine kinase n=1 Tax=Batillaria attramentaria TaxID=370345 RepID=A0ABD0M3W9_9CAEN